LYSCIVTFSIALTANRLNSLLYFTSNGREVEGYSCHPISVSGKAEEVHFG